MTHDTTAGSSTADSINNLYSSSSLTYGTFNTQRLFENSNGGNGGEQFKVNTQTFTDKNDEFSISDNGGTNNQLSMKYRNTSGADCFKGYCKICKHRCCINC